jgi:hypothetical protein
MDNLMSHDHQMLKGTLLSMVATNERHQNFILGGYLRRLRITANALVSAARPRLRTRGV